MVKNEALTTIINDIEARELSKAIQHLENYLFTFVQPVSSEQLSEIKADYELMCDYWLKGYDDPQREQLYDRLLKRMYVLTMNVYIRFCIRNSNYIGGTHASARNFRQEWSPASLRRDLESYVSDVTLLELVPEHIRQQRQHEVYEHHWQLMAALFDYIWTSRLWTDGITEAFEEMLLSPTIDSADQQLLVSAITLSVMNYFGINKFRLLMNVYRKSVDERVRQRALVGWVLSLNEEVIKLYSEIHEMVSETVADSRCRDELAELQMQIVYCLRAESDNQIIQSEIMPELMRSGNIRVTRSGIEEVDDNTLEDILHPEISEQRMERLEESMRRMADLQKQGVDIYFGGFSQMKRFPFFNRVANWFMPFMLEHPAVSDIVGKVRGQKFLRKMMTDGPFCDSDKYSFVLGYQMTINHLPENLVQMMDRGEATVAGGDVAPEELRMPAFIRRSYLQDMYRFFRVYPQRNEFLNPFDTTQKPRYLFFANRLFQQTQLEDKFGEVTSFLVKNKAYEAAKLVLQNYRTERRDVQFFLLNGTVIRRTCASHNAGLTSLDCYRTIVEMSPEDERVWGGYARALFDTHDYERALSFYQKLLERHPDSYSYQLNVAVCMANMKEYEESLKLLYKLNYEMPDNLNVTRVLAWTLMGAKKYEQAERLYEELLKVENSEVDDILNAAYQRWFAGNKSGALELFRRYAKASGGTFNAKQEFLSAETDMLCEHGINDVDARLMAGMLS